MKNKILYFIFIPLFMYSRFCIRNGLAGGRFGDNLLSYMHAKYISYRYKLPFVYKEFIYSEELMISEKDSKNSDASYKIHKGNFDQFNESLKSGDFNEKSDDGMIVEIPYFPEDKSEPNADDYIYFKVKWRDKKFKAILQETVAPKNQLKLIDLPKDKITVALHLRLGGDFENDRANRYVIPLKLPPLKFFVTSLKKLIGIFNKKEEFYVFIFTDESNTQYYLDYFRKKFPQKNIIFDCRLHGNGHDQNVLEDFFSMVKFDCLIHPLSNYSITAAKIADYLVEIEPVEFIKKDNKFIITKDRIILSDKLKEIIG